MLHRGALQSLRSNELRRVNAVPTVREGNRAILATALVHSQYKHAWLCKSLGRCRSASYEAQLPLCQSVRFHSMFPTVYPLSDTLFSDQLCVFM